jgi:hypothetical protein
MDSALISIVRHCPNLEIFIMKRPLGSAFGLAVDALSIYAFRKRWGRTCEGYLDSRLLTPHCHPCILRDPCTLCKRDGESRLSDGPAPLITLFSLRGYLEEIVEKSTGWDLRTMQPLYPLRN